MVCTTIYICIHIYLQVYADALTLGAVRSRVVVGELDGVGITSSTGLDGRYTDRLLGILIIASITLDICGYPSARLKALQPFVDK